MRRRRGPPEPEDGGDASVLVGRHAVVEALAGGGVERVLLADEPAVAAWFAREAAHAARERGVPVVRVPRQALDRLAPGVAHQGVAARTTSVRLVGLDEVVARAEPPAFFVLLDGMEDPRNLGAIIRTAAAAGASGVLLPERRTAPLGPACAKAAAGLLDRVPLARVGNVVRTLEILAEAGAWSVGLAAGATPLWEVDLVRPTCLVIGGEERGLSRLVRERCDVVAGLPLAPGVDSLNASVAFGVAAYELLRQRHGAG